MSHNVNFKDITGKKFGRLKVISLLERIGNRGERFWKCRCDCGNFSEPMGKNLHKGTTKSCGCLSREIHSELRKETIKHGLSRSSEYRTYNAIKNRCYRKEDNHFYVYGGRGIIMCPRWLESFENFYIDMGPKPSKNHSIDRIDNDGNYEPSNCRWATHSEQANNKSSTLKIEINGKLRTISELADYIGIKRMTLYARIKILKWPIERALAEPAWAGKNQSFQTRKIKNVPSDS